MTKRVGGIVCND